MNKVFFLGNIGKDPELRTFEDQSKIVKFSIATNDGYKNKQTGEWVKETQWHNVVCWGKLAEYVSSYAKKGTKVLVVGKLTHRKYEDKNQVLRYVTEVQAREVKILDKVERDESFPEPPKNVNTKGRDSKPQPVAAGDEGGESSSEDDDLPF